MTVRYFITAILFLIIISFCNDDLFDHGMKFETWRLFFFLGQGGEGPVSWPPGNGG